MPITINKHVSRLNRYLPFSPGHDQIYEERADPGQLKTIETRATQTLVDFVRDPRSRLIVLTGDAGHGKTHLCRVALERGLEIDDVNEAHRLLRERGDGTQPVGSVDGRELFVVRDLSELTSAARDRLEAAFSAEDRVTLVCANEGKLRSVVADAGGSLDVLRETLEKSQTTGRVSVREGVVVLDLNHQSVTAGDGESFLAGLLGEWVDDGRRWRACNDCPAKDLCPIRSNREHLQVDAPGGPTRREGLTLLLRVVEQCGTSITIREALILVAFAVTGGLDCEAVQIDRRASGHHGNFRERSYFQVLFAPPLERDQRASLPLLESLARLDPGRNAIRSVDEALISGPRDDLDPTADGRQWAKPSTRKQMQSEAERHRGEMAALRRRDFFDLRSDQEWKRIRGHDVPAVPRAERLGFRHHDDFERIVSSGAAGAPADLRDRILKGLEAAQDVRRGERQVTKFAVVDPAYGNVAGQASILATRISVKRIDIVPARSHWKRFSADAHLLTELVDWVDRRVVVRLNSGSESEATVGLNLSQFEFVMRSAAGLASPSFFQGEIRRIVARLNMLAHARADAEDEIKVIFEDRVCSILVESDGRIVCQVD